MSCGPSGYAYAGIQPGQTGYGVSARLASLAAPVVESGHVAGWVGVGGPGQGPGGSDEWIQVGMNSLPGATNKLYYEVMRPGLGQTYAEVATDVPNGRSFRLAVLETAATPGAWRVWVNGRPVTPAIMLTGSHGALSPMAMGESWDGGKPSCNRFAYRFDDVSLAGAPGGSWLPVRNATVLQDRGYKVVKRAEASFDAGAVTTLAAAPSTTTPAAAPKANSTRTAKPAPASVQSVTVAGSTEASPVRTLASTAIAADSPLRKGFLPSPAIEAILGIDVQPPVPAVPVAPAVAASPLVAPVAQAPAVAPAAQAPVVAAPVVAAPVATAEPGGGLGLGAGGSVAFTEAQVQ